MAFTFGGRFALPLPDPERPTDRALFEASGLPIDFRRGGWGGYAEETTRIAWEVWQAAAKAYSGVA